MSSHFFTVIRFLFENMITTSSKVKTFLRPTSPSHFLFFQQPVFSSPLSVRGATDIQNLFDYHWYCKQTIISITHTVTNIVSKQLKSMQNLSFEVLSALSQHWRESPLVPDGESKKHLDFDLRALVVISLSFSPMLVLLCRARWCNPKLEEDPLASPAEKYWPWLEKNIWG